MPYPVRSGKIVGGTEPSICGLARRCVMPFKRAPTPCPPPSHANWERLKRNAANPARKTHRTNPTRRGKNNEIKNLEDGPLSLEKSMVSPMQIAKTPTVLSGSRAQTPTVLSRFKCHNCDFTRENAGNRRKLRFSASKTMRDRLKTVGVCFGNVLKQRFPRSEVPIFTS